MEINPEKQSIEQWSETEVVGKRPGDNSQGILALWCCTLQKSTESTK